METTQGHNLVQTRTTSGQGANMLPIHYWVVEFTIRILGYPCSCAKKWQNMLLSASDTKQSALTEGTVRCKETSWKRSCGIICNIHNAYTPLPGPKL